MILTKIRDFVLNNNNLTEEDLIIRGLWATDCLFKPNNNERLFNYKFIVSQTIGQGCSYSINRHYDEKELEALIGKDYRTIKFNDLALEISILDSIYSTLQRKPNYQISLNGNSVEKADLRADIIVSEALNLINYNDLKHTKPLVCNIGVVGNVIKQLSKHNLNVIGSDFDQEIVGKKLHGNVEIIHGSRTLELISMSDVAIVTGMTLATDTLDDIITTAKNNNTKLLIFAETGSNFASLYVENGVDCVISEPYPFYIFQGTNIINIFKKDK